MRSDFSNNIELKNHSIRKLDRKLLDTQSWGFFGCGMTGIPKDI